MQTITIVTTRSSGFSLSEMEMLLGSAIVIGVLAWMVFARMRRDRHEQF
jgi:hypothetical protein